MQTAQEAHDQAVQQLLQQLQEAGIEAQGREAARHMGSMLSFRNADSALIEFLANTDIVQSVSLDGQAAPTLMDVCTYISAHLE